MRSTKIRRQLNALCAWSIRASSNYILPLPEHHRSFGWYNRVPPRGVVWLPLLAVKLDIIVEQDIRHHDLQLVHGEKPTGATPNKNMLPLLSCYKNTDLPCMFPVSEGKILWRWTNKLILHPFGTGDLVTLL